MLDEAPTLDETAAPEGTEVEAPAEETVNLEAPEEGAEQEPAPDDDHDDVEYEGDTYRLPKKLKDALLRQQDYTRKTQEVAETKRTVEAEREAVRQQAEASQAHLREVARVVSLNDQLAQFDQVNWTQLHQEDPFKANELFQQRALLKEQRDGLLSQIQANEQHRSQEAQQSFARRYAETNDALAKEIKGWSEVAPKVAEFARVNGVEPQYLREIAINPSLSKLLHKAYLGDQLINAKTTAAKTADPKVVPKPITKVTGAGARPTPNLADADMETYAALRKKQGFGQR